MNRTVVECLIPATQCAQCEERDCCRDARRVEMLRARVAELENAIRNLLHAAKPISTQLPYQTILALHQKYHDALGALHELGIKEEP